MKIQLYQAVKKNRWNLQELNSVEILLLITDLLYNRCRNLRRILLCMHLKNVDL